MIYLLLLLLLPYTELAHGKAIYRFYLQDARVYNGGAAISQPRAKVLPTGHIFESWQNLGKTLALDCDIAAATKILGWRDKSFAKSPNKNAHSMYVLSHI